MFIVFSGVENCINFCILRIFAENTEVNLRS
jgi:hypothetical protein